MALQNLVGQRFGKLTVLRYTGKGPANSRMWLCRCDCGNFHKARTSYLNFGMVRSCGCLQRERAAESIYKAHKHNTKHGESGSRAYAAWKNMLRRCHDPSSGGYYRYGGRGIKVCKRWEKFENFLTDMGQPPQKGMWLDRIDNEGDYQPGNCRWTTIAVQMRNRKSNVTFTIDGKSQCLTDWAKEYSLPMKLVWSRLNAGWDILKALTTPLRPRRVLNILLTLDGATKTLMQWARKLRVPRRLLYDRYAAGWTDKEILTTPARKYTKTR